MRRGGLIFLILAAIVIATRLCHSNVLWADDNLPLAAAIEVARGKVLYRDVWFDKPALVAWIDLLWGPRAGVPLRLAGAAYVMAVAATAWQFARTRWTDREGLFAAFFAAFFLTFGLPSAVIPLASDMLLILPHFAAVYFAWRGRAFLSGLSAGIGLLCSSKAIFVLAACALWQWRQLPLLLIGFLAPNAVALTWMWLHGSAQEYYRQAWQWGRIYAANTFVEHPLREGIVRTANWIGFQAALVVGAIVAIRRERRLAVWISLSFAGVILGLRFFPRYYFLLLPPTIMAASRGWSLLLIAPCGRVSDERTTSSVSYRAATTGSDHKLATLALCALLAVPLIRFGKPYLTLARGATLTDLAMDRDSRAASEKLRALSHPGDTLFVWGFRPDIFIDSQIPPGTRFLESQPISGVLADRHLFSTASIAPDFTAPNVRELLTTKPTWIVDGLGPYNPRLALNKEAALADWFSHYTEVARTDFSILYRRN